jgi:hypothetical protein
VGEEAAERETGGPEAGNEADALGAVCWTDKEKVRDRLRDSAVSAEGGGGEFESVEVCVEPDVAGAELGEDAAAGSAEVLVHLRHA